MSGVLRSVIRIKDDMVTDAGLKHPWISYGLPDELVVDNGLEFHSFGFKTMALTLGCDITYCRVRTPWLKPQVERFFSTLNTLTLTKGRVSKTVANVMRIDPYKDAAITFSDLVKGLLMFCVDDGALIALVGDRFARFRREQTGTLQIPTADGGIVGARPRGKLPLAPAARPAQASRVI